MKPLNVDFGQKANFYQKSSPAALAAMIPLSGGFGNMDTVLVGPQVVPKVMGKAVVSHFWDDFGLPVDAVVADGLSAQSDIVDLLNNSVFRIGAVGLTFPRRLADFRTDGCVDSEGYANWGRSVGCFSLVVADAVGVEVRSGNLIANHLNRTNSELLDFLANYHPKAERSVQTDSLCPETYDGELPILGTDFCSQISYPDRFFRICCCFADFRLCHVHSNPLNKPADRYRCLDGEFDSANENATIKILKDREADSVKKLFARCYIQYRITLREEGEVIMKIKNGGIDSETQNIDGFAIPKTNGMYSIPVSDCPKESFFDVYGDLNLINFCSGDFCNHDSFLSRFLEGIQKFTEICTGIPSLAAHLANGDQICNNFVDQWNLKEYDYPSRKLVHLPRRTEFLETKKNVSVIRYEYLNTAVDECFKDEGPPIRVVDKYKCRPNDGPNNCYALLGLDITYPQCHQAALSEVRTMIEVEIFMGMDNKTFNWARRSNRCFAAADLYLKDGDPIFNLTAASHPDWLDKCMTATVEADCTHWTEGKTEIICCHHSVDPRVELSRWIKSIILPSKPQDIKHFVDSQKQRKICIAFPKPIRSASENITNQIHCDYGYGDEGMSEADKQRFEFCRRMQNTPKCQLINADAEKLHDLLHGDHHHHPPKHVAPAEDVWAKVEFCCCSGDEEDCEMDMRRWGRKIASFVND